MSSTPTPPPPPPPPARGYERHLVVGPPVAAPPAELIVFLIVWVVAFIITVASDAVGWEAFLTATVVLASAFMISRGIAKAGKVLGP